MAFYSRAKANTFIAKIKRDRLFDHASSLTYTSILSLIPMIAVAYAIFSAFGGFEKYRAEVEPFLARNLAPAFAEQVQSYVSSIQNGLSAETLGIFGIVGFLITSVLMLDKSEAAFNEIWGAVKPRPMLRRFTNYWTLITLGPVLMGASIAIATKAIGYLQADSGDIARLSLPLAAFLAPYLLSVALFFTLFYILPNAVLHVREAFYSALVTAFVFEIAKQGYAVYAAYAVKSSVYGSLSTLPVFFLWIYVTWMITLVGFELCCFLEARRMGVRYFDDSDVTLDVILLLDVLECLGEAQIAGKGMELKHLLKRLNLSRPALLIHLAFLQDQRMIIETDSGERGVQCYHLAFSRERLDPRPVVESLENIRFKPVGPITRVIAREHQLALLEWSLRVQKRDDQILSTVPNTSEPPVIEH